MNLQQTADESGQIIRSNVPKKKKLCTIRKSTNNREIGENSHTCCDYTRSNHVGYRHDVVNSQMISELEFFPPVGPHIGIDCVFVIIY